MNFNKLLILQMTEIMYKAGIQLWLWITGEDTAQVQCQSHITREKNEVIFTI